MKNHKFPPVERREERTGAGERIMREGGREERIATPSSMGEKNKILVHVRLHSLNRGNEANCSGSFPSWRRKDMEDARAGKLTL